MNMSELTDAELNAVAGGYSKEGIRVIEKYLVPLFGKEIFKESPSLVMKKCEEYVMPKHLCRSLKN